MEEIYETLAKNGLTDDHHIEHLIMNQWPIARVINLKENLDNLINKNNASPVKPDLSRFSFNGNSEITAQHAACPNWDCRLSRIDQLGRFAAFYADSVYIQNYFADASHVPSNEFQESMVRYELVGDIKILYKLKKLIFNNIIHFVPAMSLTGISDICPKCLKKYIPNHRAIDRYLRKISKEMSNEYLNCTEVVAHLLVDSPNVRVYDFNIKGPEELYEHGEMIRTVTENSLSKPMQRKLKALPISKLKNGYNLSKEEIKDFKVNEQTLLEIFDDIWAQQCLCGMSGSNLKYLTHREIDIQFLNAITNSSELRAYNDVIKNNLIYKLPIILGIPLESILDIRKNNYDSFITCRYPRAKLVAL